ncbi:MAG: genome maintenance MGM101-like protein [Podoviridae sp. cty5g4]|nr:MAG: genome maintenance MGM101-like protein [Podoviridae sp. cty5g4]
MTEEIAMAEEKEVPVIGGLAVERYEGISVLPVTDKQAEILIKPVEISEIEIKPTGEIYICHIQYRRRLNAAFGIGQWALKPIGGFIKTQKNHFGKIQQTVCREYALYIAGKFAASAIGEATYIEENMQMTWSDACEATKSNAIMRCCKDIGIGLEMWDKKFSEQFKKVYCVCVFRKGSTKPHWRLKTSEPFYDETGRPAGKPETKTPQPIVPETIQVKTSIVSVAKTKTGDLVTFKMSDKDGVVYSTTKEGFVTLAKSAKDASLLILLTHKNDAAKTIENIEILEPDLDINSPAGLADLQKASNALTGA